MSEEQARPLDLDAVEGRANAATPGPWKAIKLAEADAWYCEGGVMRGQHLTILARDGGRVVDAVSTDQHCTGCGARLVLHKRGYQFTPSGEPVDAWRCPRSSWWRRLVMDRCGWTTVLTTDGRFHGLC
jgi:hypothetical protein